MSKCECCGKEITTRNHYSALGVDYWICNECYDKMDKLCKGLISPDDVITIETTNGLKSFISLKGKSSSSEQKDNKPPVKSEESSLGVAVEGLSLVFLVVSILGSVFLFSYNPIYGFAGFIGSAFLCMIFYTIGKIYTKVDSIEAKLEKLEREYSNDSKSNI